MSGHEADRACMERLRNGDVEALRELYARHSPMLQGLAVRILGRAPDAEEVLQDTWVQVWRRADTWDPSRGSVTAWLLTLCRSRAIDRLRATASRLRAETTAPPPEAGHSDEPAEDADRNRLRGRMSAALSALGPEQRQVLELAYFGGLSQTEIAARLDAPLGTVKSWTRQGLQKLRESVPREDRM